MADTNTPSGVEDRAEITMLLMTDHLHSVRDLKHIICAVSPNHTRPHSGPKSRHYGFSITHAPANVRTAFCSVACSPGNGRNLGHRQVPCKLVFPFRCKQSTDSTSWLIQWRFSEWFCGVRGRGAERLDREVLSQSRRPHLGRGSSVSFVKREVCGTRRPHCILPYECLC